MRTNQRVSFVCGMAILTPLAACFSLDRPPADKRRFLLEATRPDQRPAAGDRHLMVAAMHVQEPWAGPGFVHRLPGGELRADYTHEFFVPAGVMLAQITRRWLVDAGLFASAGGESSRVQPTHWLEADVLELSVDARTPNDVHAVLEVEFVLLDEHRIAHRARFKHREPLHDDRAETIVAGWNACIAAVLTSVSDTFVHS